MILQGADHKVLLTATNVPGRNIIVMMAINVIFLLSVLAAIAILKFALVSAYLGSVRERRNFRVRLLATIPSLAWRS